MKVVYEIGFLGLTRTNKNICIRIYNFEDGRVLDEFLSFEQALEFLRVYAILLRDLVRREIEEYEKLLRTLPEKHERRKVYENSKKRLEDLFQKLIDLEHWFDKDVEKEGGESVGEDVSCKDMDVV